MGNSIFGLFSGVNNANALDFSCENLKKSKKIERASGSLKSNIDESHRNEAPLYSDFDLEPRLSWTLRL